MGERRANRQDAKAAKVEEILSGCFPSPLGGLGALVSWRQLSDSAFLPGTELYLASAAAARCAGLAALRPGAFRIWIRIRENRTTRSVWDAGLREAACLTEPGAHRGSVATVDAVVPTGTSSRRARASTYIYLQVSPVPQVNPGAQSSFVAQLLGQFA